jgi:hypothetical protein
MGRIFRTYEPSIILPKKLEILFWLSIVWNPNIFLPLKSWNIVSTNNKLIASAHDIKKKL